MEARWYQESAIVAAVSRLLKRVQAGLPKSQLVRAVRRGREGFSRSRPQAFGWFVAGCAGAVVILGIASGSTLGFTDVLVRGALLVVVTAFVVRWARSRQR